MNGIRLVENTEENRVQLYFPGKALGSGPPAFEREMVSSGHPSTGAGNVTGPHTPLNWRSDSWKKPAILRLNPIESPFIEPG